MADSPNFPADPAGVFASDVHRRVLGHLSTPDEAVGYTTAAQIARTEPDRFVPISDPAAIEAVLRELEADGDAVEHDGGVWQMSKAGFKKLTGPATDEAIAAHPEGPAQLDRAVPIDPTAPEGQQPTVPGADRRKPDAPVAIPKDTKAK